LKHRSWPKFFFNLEQTIIFGNAFASTQRTRLDLSAAKRNCQIGNERVFRFSRPVRYHITPFRRSTQVDGRYGFRQCADLIKFDQHGIGCFAPHALDDEFGVRDIKVIADDLDLFTFREGLCDEPLPVVFGEAVLYRDDRIFCYPLIIKPK